jgi:hypothetical protein
MPDVVDTWGELAIGIPVTQLRCVGESNRSKTKMS